MTCWNLVTFIPIECPNIGSSEAPTRCPSNLSSRSFDGFAVVFWVFTTDNTFRSLPASPRTCWGWNQRKARRIPEIKRTETRNSQLKAAKINNSWEGWGEGKSKRWCCVRVARKKVWTKIAENSRLLYGHLSLLGSSNNDWPLVVTLRVPRLFVSSIKLKLSTINTYWNPHSIKS